MPWFRVDDGSDFHEKVVQAGNEAWGAVCRAGAWASRQRTDGFVPDHISLLIAPEKVWRRAENARGSRGEHGLVERCQGGWQIHDFCEWNPSAEELEKHRLELSEKRKLAGLAGNTKRWYGHRKAVANGIANASQTPRTCEGRDLAPIPSHPIPLTDPEIPDPDLHAAACPPIAKLAKRVRAPKAEVDPGFVPVRDCWFKTFESVRGVKPSFDARDGKAIKTLLGKLGEARACEAIRNAFADGWWAANRASLSDLASNPNPHLGAKPRINGKQQQILQPSAGKQWGEIAKAPTDAEWAEFEAKGVF